MKMKRLILKKKNIGSQAPMLYTSYALSALFMRAFKFKVEAKS